MENHAPVKCQIIDPELKKSYGPFHHYPYQIALKGERAGKWRIVRENAPVHIYENKMMTADSNIGPCLPIGRGYEIPQLRYQTKAQKKTKVAWIMDNALVGGAEMSCREIIRVGIDCGYNIAVVTPDHFSKDDLKTDVIILNNIWGFKDDQMRKLSLALYHDRIPYIKYEHDHRELNRPEFSRRLFQSSRLNVFLSPMHLENHKKALGCDGICLPLAINPDEWNVIDGIQRQANTALICNVRNFKSWEKLQTYIREHPNIEFFILTNLKPPVQGRNVQARKMVNISQMPMLYSEHEYIVHLLDGLGAGERVIFEGALCGCKIISDDHSGHISWGKDLSDLDNLRSWLRKAPYQFWREIDRAI